MILGLPTATYTLIHVIISLIAIATGLIVLFGLLSNRRMSGITAVFLIFTALTSLTGFAFPNTHLTPGLKVGIISMVVLAVAALARYGFHLAGVWRRAYVVTAMVALYLNVFVLIVQLFEKVPALRALAPHQTEAPFAVTQLAVLLLFIVLTTFAAIKFRTEALSAA